MLISSLPSLLPSYSKATDATQSVTVNDDKSLDNSSSPSTSKTLDNELSIQRELQVLKNRDREVRAHELAHISAGGRYITSGARFNYQKGPDGRLYAVSGDVSIDTSEIAGDPRATLIKAQVIARAALAPANPSPQDRNVATQASAMIQQARVDLALLLSESTSTNVGQKLDAFA